jgi:hypothetical protein
MEPLATGAEPERIARLEERMGLVQALLEEIRGEQKEMAETIARASGGLRVLLLLGGLAGVAGTMRGIAAWAAGLLAHAP